MTTGPPTLTFRGRDDKLDAMGRLLAPQLAGDVLDVGADRGRLGRHVGGRYVGVDASAGADVTVDLEEGLPFEDRSFDTVVAFDVLEHLDRAHAVFDELCRVADRWVVVGLPNMYEWHFRLRYARGLALSGKYGLPAAAPADRHRWLFGLREARGFCVERGRTQGFEPAGEALGYYCYRHPLARTLTRAGRRLSPRASGLLAYHLTTILQRRPS